MKNSLFFLILQFPPNKCATAVIPGGHGKKGLIRTAARSILAEEKELQCVLDKYNDERLKRNCLPAHGNRKMNSSQGFKGGKAQILCSSKDRKVLGKIVWGNIWLSVTEGFCEEVRHICLE